MGENVKSVNVEELLNSHRNLIESYKGIYESQVRDFNALSTIHLSENDHTNVLCEILNMKVMGKKPFMESFVKDILDIRDGNLDCDELVAKTQERAIGTAKNVTKKNKESAGFIDLLIEEEKKPHTFIIVENKVCGAGDGDDQLARYYFTYKNDEEALKIYYAQDSDFKDKCEQYWLFANKADDKNDVYLVYLTDYTNEDQQTDEDAKEKCPTKMSIKPELLKKLDKEDKYRHISYEEHIYSWLKDQVLPLMPYGKNGDAHHSVLLYIRELENMFATNDAQNKWYLENPKIQEQIINPILYQQSKNTEQYKALDKVYKGLKQKAEKSREESSPALNDLLSCVLCHRDNVFGKYAPEGWTVYCAADYITFYKTHWLDRYGGSKTASIHFHFNKWQKNGAPELLHLCIHHKACKKYIVDATTDQYAQLLEKLSNSEIMAQKQDSRINDIEKRQDNFAKKKDWQIEYNIKKLAETKWDPDNCEKFFENIINNPDFSAIVKWIDENLK